MSGYYNYKKRQAEQEAAEKDYQAQIRKLFDDSRGTYGVDRICGKLRQLGYNASYGKVKRLMEEMGLKSIHNKTAATQSDRQPESPRRGISDLVKDIEITTPFQVVSSDISYIRTGATSVRSEML